MLSGSYLHLYDEVPPEGDPDAQGDDDATDFGGDTPAGPVKQEYVVMRNPNQCILDQDESRLQFVLQVQDCANKHRPKNLIVSVPTAVNKFKGGGSFTQPSPHGSQMSRRTGASLSKMSKSM